MKICNSLIALTRMFTHHLPMLASSALCATFFGIETFPAKVRAQHRMRDAMEAKPASVSILSMCDWTHDEHPSEQHRQSIK
jgi:hypothetical protein